MEKQKVLFISWDNSARSLIAAVFLNAYFGDRYEAYSLWGRALSNKSSRV